MTLNELPVSAISAINTAGEVGLDELAARSPAGKAIDENCLLALTQRQMRSWLPQLKKKYAPALIHADDDLIQEALLRVHLCLKRLRSAERFAAFAFGVLRNVVRESFKKNIRERALLRNEIEQIRKKCGWTSKPATDAAVLENDLRRQLKLAIATLMPPHQKVFTLLLQEMDREEIQREFEISSRAFYTCVCRGRRAIRQFLIGQGAI